MRYDYSKGFDTALQRKLFEYIVDSTRTAFIDGYVNAYIEAKGNNVGSTLKANAAWKTYYSLTDRYYRQIVFELTVTRRIALVAMGGIDSGQDAAYYEEEATRKAGDEQR